MRQLQQRVGLVGLVGLFCSALPSPALLGFGGREASKQAVTTQHTDKVTA